MNYHLEPLWGKMDLLFLRVWTYMIDDRTLAAFGYLQKSWTKITNLITKSYSWDPINRLMTKTLNSILLLVSIFLYHHTSGQEARSLTYELKNVNSIIDVYDWEDYNRIRGINHIISFSTMVVGGEYDVFTPGGFNYTGSYQFLGVHSSFVRANPYRIRAWDSEPKNKYWSGAEMGTALMLSL